MKSRQITPPRRSGSRFDAIRDATTPDVDGIIEHPRCRYQAVPASPAFGYRVLDTLTGHLLTEAELAALTDEQVLQEYGTA